MSLVHFVNKNKNKEFWSGIDKTDVNADLVKESIGCLGTSPIGFSVKKQLARAPTSSKLCLIILAGCQVHLTTWWLVLPLAVAWHSVTLLSGWTARMSCPLFATGYPGRLSHWINQNSMLMSWPETTKHTNVLLMTQGFRIDLSFLSRPQNVFSLQWNCHLQAISWGSIEVKTKSGV